MFHPLQAGILMPTFQMKKLRHRRALAKKKGKAASVSMQP